MDSIRDRLIRFYTSLGISKREFERVIGASNGYIDKLKHAPSPEKMESILLHYPQLSKVWLLTGDGEMLYSDAEKNKISENSSPCFDLATIQGGTGHGTGMEQITTNMVDMAVGRMLIPGAPTGNSIPYIQVRGNSMLNRTNPALSIPDGAWVGLKPSTLNTIRWGEVYAVMTTDGPIIKKLVQSEREGFIRFVSFNEEDGFTPFELPYTDIIPPLYNIIGVVSVKRWK